MDSEQLQGLMALPPAVRNYFGFALWLAQAGDQADTAKVLKGFISAVPACWRLSRTMSAARIGPSTR